MTPKEVEHALIDAGFDYHKRDGDSGYWFKEGGYRYFSDRMVQEEPQQVKKSLQEILGDQEK